MNRYYFSRFVIFAVAVSLVIVSANSLNAQGGDNYRPAIGVQHPDFQLPSIDDRSQIRLSDFRGKKVLLFHFASW